MSPLSNESNLTNHEAILDRESQYYFLASVFIIKFGLPIIILAGVFGNTMVVIIQRRLAETQDGGLSLYFTSLAVSDLVLILLNPVFVVLEAYDVTLDESLDPLFKLRNWVIYTTGWTSPWLLIALTTQRAASIIWPHKVRLLFSRQKSRLYVLGLTFICASVNSHILYGHSLKSQERSGQLVYSAFPYVSEEYRAFFEGVWSRVDMLVSVFIPFVLLFSGNALLIKTVSQSVRDLRSNFGLGNSLVLKSRENKVSSMNIRLISVLVTFLILTTPICVFFILHETVSYDTENDPRAMAANQLWFAVGMLLWYLNFAANFYAYCLSGKKYRRECARVFHCISDRKVNVFITPILMPDTFINVEHPSRTSTEQ